MLVVLSRFRWQREAQRAAERVAASGGSVELASTLPPEDSASKLSPAASDDGATERAGSGIRATIQIGP